MTISVGNKSKKEITKILEEKLKKSDSDGKLLKHFGKLKRKLDGLNYQLEMRENEN
jgi:hypothetical protein